MIDTEKSTAPQEAVNTLPHFGAVPLALVPKLLAAGDVPCRTYLAMLPYANFKTGECYPSVGTLADEIGVHPETVRRAIRKLEEVGAIKKTEHRLREDGRPDVNLYTLNLIPAPAQVTRASAGNDTCASAGNIPAPAQGELPPGEPPPSERRKGAAAAAVVFPAGFDSEEVREAFQRWIDYRSEIRKPLKPASQQGLLKKWASTGTERFVAAVAHSIAQGWQGLYEPTHGGSKDGRTNYNFDPSQPGYGKF